LNRLATNLGFSIGPALGGYVARGDYTRLFWIDGLTSLAAAGLAAALLPYARARRTSAPPAGAARWEGGPRDLVRLLPLSFGVGLLLIQILGTFPLYLRTVYGLDEAWLGRLIAINTALIVLVEMPLIHHLRGVRPERVLAVGTLLLGLGFALMPFGRGIAYAAATVVVWSVGEILALPTLLALVSSRAGAGTQGEALGRMSLAFSAATALGPLLGMGLYAWAGGDSVWYACGLLGVVLCAAFVQMDVASAETRARFEAAPASTS
jgi:predicted MFS family arabinose efflux permease